jgi:hypothetical protein
MQQPRELTLPAADWLAGGFPLPDRGEYEPSAEELKAEKENARIDAWQEILLDPDLAKFYLPGLVDLAADELVAGGYERGADVDDGGNLIPRFVFKKGIHEALQAGAWRLAASCQRPSSVKVGQRFVWRPGRVARRSPVRRRRRVRSGSRGDPPRPDEPADPDLDPGLGRGRLGVVRGLT